MSAQKRAGDITGDALLSGDDSSKRARPTISAPDASAAAVRRNGLNPHLAALPIDFLYHIGLSTSDDLPGYFSDVRVVCFGGSRTRMEGFAKAVAGVLDLEPPCGQGLVDISRTDRYHVFKAGPVLSVSHGIGCPSASIVLHEVVKMLAYAGCDIKNASFVRIGTSGGLGVAPGTVVLTTEALDGLLRAEQRLAVLGEEQVRPAQLDADLTDEIESCSPPTVNIVRGRTMCCDGFYECQGRLDGAACDYTDADKMAFLHRAHAKGVRNVEMESLAFAAFFNHLGLRAAVVCCTLLDRFQGDQLTKDAAALKGYSKNSQLVVLAWIGKTLGKGHVDS